MISLSKLSSSLPSLPFFVVDVVVVQRCQVVFVFAVYEFGMSLISLSLLLLSLPVLSLMLLSLSLLSS